MSPRSKSFNLNFCTFVEDIGQSLTKTIYLGILKLDIEILNAVRYTTPTFPLEEIYWYIDVVRNDVYIN